MFCDLKKVYIHCNNMHEVNWEAVKVKATEQQFVKRKLLESCISAKDKHEVTWTAATHLVQYGNHLCSHSFSHVQIVLHSCCLSVFQYMMHYKFFMCV